MIFTKVCVQLCNSKNILLVAVFKVWFITSHQTSQQHKNVSLELLNDSTNFPPVFQNFTRCVKTTNIYSRTLSQLSRVFKCLSNGRNIKNGTFDVAFTEKRKPAKIVRCRHFLQNCQHFPDALVISLSSDGEMKV